MIDILNISKTYRGPSGAFTALDNVSFSVRAGEIYGIIGESGAGKSTLVRCINLLERPTSGSILFDNVDVTHYVGRQLRELRAQIGMVFQGLSLFQQQNVFDNVMFPARLTVASACRSSREADADRARKLLDLVGLSSKETAYPTQLSGGQQQRVAIARALMTNPRVVLCDEATSALDTLTTNAVLDLLASINAELGVTIVLITHSLVVARRICTRIAVMDAGKIVETGSPEQIFEDPQAAATRLLLQA